MTELKGGEEDAWPFAQPTNMSKTCRLIDYTSFEVIKGFTGAYILVVLGEDHPQIIPSLNPYVYVTKPDYHEIEVVGCLIGIVPPKEVRNFPLSMGLDNVMGHKGIRLIGATKSEQWDMPKK